MKNIEGLLARAGLTPNESKVYVALVREGEHNVANIGRLTNLFRPAVYRAINSLMTRGLVSAVPGHKQPHYRAAPLASLRGSIEQLTEDLESLLPYLEKEQRSMAPGVQVLKGRAGIRAVFADLVASSKRGSTFFRYTSERDLDKVNSYLPKTYRTDRDNKQLQRFVISNVVSGSRKKTRMERGIKFIPKQYDPFEQNVIQLIYADKVAIIDLNTETSIIVENAAIADFQVKLFKLLYSKL